VTRIRIGCSGWNYPHWRGRLYPRGEPQRRWLELYAERFDTVEVNATFYRLPSRDTVRTWCEQTPADFRFAIKASRYLTHVRRLRDVSDGTRRLSDRLEPMARSGRLGPILWQLPESFPRDDARLEDWLAAVDRWPGRHTIEFRHPSWFAAPVLRTLGDHDVALTIGDHPERPFQRRVATAGWRYVRLHHGAHGGDGRYSEGELATWARRVAQWRRHGDVYAYFNNDWCGFAPDNAGSLSRRLRVGTAGRQ
jgi:uncharacterized protein YecE (DUF72 family)